MLRENLDSVLKDLLEFKPNENVASHYPGPHLDAMDDLYRSDKSMDFLLDTADLESKKMFNVSSANEYKYELSPSRDKTEIVNRIRRYLDKKSKEFGKPVLKMKDKLNKLISKKDKNRNKRLKRAVYTRSYNTADQTKKGKEIYKKKKRKYVVKTKEIVLGRKLQSFKGNGRRKRQIQNPHIWQDFIQNGLNHTEGEDPTRGDAGLKARFLFKSCMNYEILQKRGHQPLLDLLNRFGGWPILDPHWNASDFNWIELMGRLRLFNNDILISEWVGPDIKNSDEFVIQFDQTSLGKR